MEAQFINVDLNCPVVIESLNEVECSTMFATNSSVNSTSGTLILSFVISMSVLVILIIAIVIIVIVYNRKRNSREGVA